MWRWPQDPKLTVTCDNTHFLLECLLWPRTGPAFFSTQTLGLGALVDALEWMASSATEGDHRGREAAGPALRASSCLCPCAISRALKLRSGALLVESMGTFFSISWNAYIMLYWMRLFSF